MKTKIYLRIWQISTIVITPIFIVVEPKEWYAALIAGPLFGLGIAIFSEWTCRVMDSIKELGWRSLLIFPPEKPKKLPLIYRIMWKIFG